MKIKRYAVLDVVATLHGEKPTPTPNGDWCRSTDVDALEAENARLRQIVVAAQDLPITLACELRGRGMAVSAKRIDQLTDAVSAYDAAKEKKT